MAGVGRLKGDVPKVLLILNRVEGLVALEMWVSLPGQSMPRAVIAECSGAAQDCPIALKQGSMFSCIP